MSVSVRAITTRLAVDGETEFKKAMSEVNATMRALKSEMQLTDAEFKGQANSMEALQKKQDILKKQYAQQQEVVKALDQAVKDSTAAYEKQGGSVDELDKHTLDLISQLNRAKTAEINLNKALEDNTKYLKEAEESADGCAKSIDGFGREVKDAADETSTLPGPLGEIQGALDSLKNADGSFNLGNVSKALSTIKGALVGGALVTGAKEVIGAIYDIVESTEEFRESTAKLEVAYERAGYSSEQAATAFKAFYEVTGDIGASTTAANNIATLGLSYEQMKVMIDAVIGANVLLGDSVPVDSLAESIADTVTLGTVSGNLADVLNRLGINEDDFNKSLSSTNDAFARLTMIVSALRAFGMTQMLEEYRIAAADVIKMRDAQLELNAAMAELGELLAPLVSALTGFSADAVKAAVVIVEKIDWIISKVQEAKEKIDELSEKSAAVGVTTGIADYFKNRSLESAINNIGALRVPYNIYKTVKGISSLSGSHAAGLDRVPYDGYIAELHADEAVLNAQEAALWRSAARYGAGNARAVSVPTQTPASAQSGAGRESVTIDVTLELDGQTLARKQYPLMQAEQRRRGVPLAGKEGT